MTDPATPQISSAYPALKRAFDIAFSAALLLALSPILLAVSLLVKLTSAGPVFFRQVRIGKDGSEFTLFKFRSMYVDAPAYALTPTDDEDPRITQVGRFLRPSSVDELPQMINVLLGDMSIVGPRPEMPFLVAQYTPEQRRRLVVKPGLTGLWQISPARYELIHENLQYDFYYIEHASFALDVKVVLQTIALVLRDSLAAAQRLYRRLSRQAPKVVRAAEPALAPLSSGYGTRSTRTAGRAGRSAAAAVQLHDE